MSWKTWPYWLKGGIIVALLGLLVICIIFGLGYKDCFVDHNSEACMGLVLGSALLGAPVFLFLAEVLRINLFNFSEYLGRGPFSELIYVAIWGLVTNFVIGTIIGAIIGWIVRKIKSRNQ